MMHYFTPVGFWEQCPPLHVPWPLSLVIAIASLVAAYPTAILMIFGRSMTVKVAALVVLLGLTSAFVGLVSDRNPILVLQATAGCAP